MIAPADDRDRIGPYRVLKAIGAGGSARIDLARIDRAYNFQRHVVLKRPLEHLRDDPKAAASLRREARIGGMLRHPNLVAILDAGIHDRYDYLVLEYIHGASLRTAMQTDAPGRVAEVPLAVALAIVIDTARGLHAAHELTDDTGASLGLVHRDVSPGNVLLGLDGTVKLADFGIAKETRVTTLSGSLHGTVTYMAPEQCRGHAFDRRADLFSLGVILYELVTGTRLFWADNDVASLHRVLSGQVPPPRSVRPEIPAALEAIILSALAPDPERRHATARAFADALERFATDHGEQLGARWIARWMHELIGPRDVPWFGSSTQVDIAIVPGDGSLVAIIAATPDDAASRPESFGPDDGSGIDDPAAPELASSPAGRGSRSRRVWLSALVATGLVGAGIAATKLATSTSPTPTTSSSPPTPLALPPPPATPAPPPRAAPAQASTPPAQPISPSRRRTRTKSTSRPAARIDAQAAPAPTTGSGKATGSGKTTVEWDPTILLPTDRSGSKK
jgi:serine/threonine-protein kinase